MLTRLSLRDFRSHSGFEMACAAPLVALWGENGAGKTNVLEAISLLAPGRGLRGAAQSDLPRQGGDGGWAVAATLTTATGPVDLGTGSPPGDTRRLVQIDGVRRRGPGALGELLAISWATPAMDRLFAEASSGRRRFVDRLVYAIDPDQAGRLGAYEQAMRERLRLLREGRPDPVWLSALEDTMARHGVAAAAARRHLIDQLAARLAADPDDLFPHPAISLAGTVETGLGDQPALAVETDLRARLAEGRRRDAETGTTGCGPHRADLMVTHVGKGVPAALCSTGEQKGLLLALLLAHARLVRDLRGAPPLLLLDEVAAHLDGGRRAALFTRLRGLGGQSWLTGTDAGLFSDLGADALRLQLPVPPAH